MSVPKLRFKADDGSDFPEGKEKELGELIDIIHGFAFQGEYFTEFPTDYIVMTPRNFKIGGGFQEHDTVFYNHSFPKKYILNENDLVVMMTDLSKKSDTLGAPAIIPTSEQKYLHNQRIGKVIIKNSSIDKNYLFYVMSTDQYHKFIVFTAAGTTVKHSSPKRICKYSFAVPCISEQQKIADFFSKLDQIIDKTQAEVDAWEKQKHGMMQKLFSQAIRFKADDRSEYPEWEEKKLSEIASMHARIGWQNLRTDEFMDHGDYLLVTGTDFDNGRINYETCHYVSKERYAQDPNIQISNDTILVTKDGTLGKVAFVIDLNMPATLNAGVFAIKTLNNSVLPKYLYQWMAAPMLLKYATEKSTGGTIKHLNQNILVDFPVGVPCIEEQQKIADCLSAFDSVINKTKMELRAYKQLKKGLMQQMFV